MNVWLKLALVTVLTVCVSTEALALVLDFDHLPTGTIVQSSDLPSGYTITPFNRHASRPDEVIIFDSACPPGGTGIECSGQDPDLLTPGEGANNDTPQYKILIVPTDVTDTAPADGLVDDPDDEQSGSTVTLTFPAPAKLTSLRLVDIDSNEENTKVILNLTGGGTLELFALPLGNNSAQTIVVPEPVPDIDGFVVDCEGSCAIDDIFIDEEAVAPATTTTTTTILTATTTTTTTTTSTTTTTTSTTTTTTSTTTTTLAPRCGDGNVDPDEQCDVGDANNSNEPDATCREDCTEQRCGDGIVDPGSSEQCEPILPGYENCANQLDDDNDNLIDCEDPDCPPDVPQCGFDCVLAVCTPIRRDPAIIRFNKDDSKPDLFKIHGHFLAAPELDFTTDLFAVMLSNSHSVIFQGTLVPGELQRKRGGKGRYVFRDRSAKKDNGDTDGIGRMTMRLKESDGESLVFFRASSYGDFSSADEAMMTTQIIAGNSTGTLTSAWKQRSRGWILKQKFFGKLPD